MSAGVGVARVWQVDGRTLAITWIDGLTQTWDVVALRQRCPCAACVDEATGARTGPPVSDEVRPRAVRSVGRYALTIAFDDAHDTGIYPYALLRRWGTTAPGGGVGPP